MLRPLIKASVRRSAKCVIELVGRVVVVWTVDGLTPSTSVKIIDSVTKLTLVDEKNAV